MGNRIFNEASKWVHRATAASKETGSKDEELIAKAQNALSSAYANSTTAEKMQLRDLQNRLDQIQ
ncbi:MAG TPA: DUF3813 domain-containing protein [Bacillus sp. (in: firmicutes)]|uniref:DUF3813 domain-containing protein n=1 Tax=Bacillus litorisediminis TaxID=2922713 RepID=UPI001FAE4D5B|nr:DUF3813 domain-containing protein [Bacillus litorisediminis]HWO75056.1 DUF3813 domain-containing protein [Bacillus sp. (in: firmicutes)]